MKLTIVVGTDTRRNKAVNGRDQKMTIWSNEYQISIREGKIYRDKLLRPSLTQKSP